MNEPIGSCGFLTADIKLLLTETLQVDNLSVNGAAVNVRVTNSHIILKLPYLHCVNMYKNVFFLFFFYINTRLYLLYPMNSCLHSDACRSGTLVGLFSLFWSMLTLTESHNSNLTPSLPCGTLTGWAGSFQSALSASHLIKTAFSERWLFELQRL